MMNTRKQLTAAQELTVFRRAIRLLPMLARRGLNPKDALAVAYNTAFLSVALQRGRLPLSPKRVLKRYPLAGIAALCEEYLAENDMERGVNINFREVLP